MHHKKYITLLVFVLTIIFYTYTLSPSLAWGDGTRLQSEAISGESIVMAEMTSEEFSPDPHVFAKVGVTAWDHPLYIVLGNTLVKSFPSADPLWLVNLVSAVFGAATIPLVFLLALRFTKSIAASLYAAFALAVSHTFWWHSSTPEVYTLFAFLMALSLTFFDQFEQTGKITYLTGSAFFLGLSASNHILAFLAIPALGLYLLLTGKIKRDPGLNLNNILSCLLAFLAGFSLYIVQFIRMTRNFTLGEILGPALGSTFLNGLDAFSPLLIGESILAYLLFILIQFGPVGVALGILGIQKIYGIEDRSVWKTLSFFIVYAIFGILYRVSDQFAFFLTSYIFFAILMGIGASHLFSDIRKRVRFPLAVILILSIVLTPPFYHMLPALAERNNIDDTFLGIPQIGTGVRNGLAYYIDPYKHGDQQAHDFGSRIITNLPRDAVVIAEWYTDTDEFFILRYFNKIEGMRPDVNIYGWMTTAHTAFDPQIAMDVIGDSFPQRPVYLASLSERFYAASRLVEVYCIVPENYLYRLYSRGDGDHECLGIDSITE